MRQKIADLINVVFGFRKFLAWFALLIVGIVFRSLALIDGGQFVDLMKTTFMGFVAGNGVEHLVSVAKQYYSSKGSQSDPKTDDSGDDVVVGNGK